MRLWLATCVFQWSHLSQRITREIFHPCRRLPTSWIIFWHERISITRINCWPFGATRFFYWSKLNCNKCPSLRKKSFRRIKKKFQLRKPSIHSPCCLYRMRDEDAWMSIKPRKTNLKRWQHKYSYCILRWRFHFVLNLQNNFPEILRERSIVT